MSNDDDDILRQAIQRDLQVLEQEAPPMHFAKLWHQVRVQRERTLQRQLAMTSTLAASSLLIVGLGSALAGYALQAAIPCCAVAFWLAPQTFGALLEQGLSTPARPMPSSRRGRR